MFDGFGMGVSDGGKLVEWIRGVGIAECSGMALSDSLRDAVWAALRCSNSARVLRRSSSSFSFGSLACHMLA